MTRGRSAARGPAPCRLRACAAGAALLAALLLAGGAGPRPAGASPAVDAIVADLRADGVHVSARAMGPAAAAARRDLIEARDELARERRDVAFVIVPGPVGAPGMPALARRLHREAEIDGSIIITAPGRPAIPWGVDPRPPVIAAIAASGANRLPNPVERLARAAEIAVPPRPEADGLRELLVLLLLGGLGAAWAVAWGTHRTDRQARTAVNEARMQLRVWLDALRAQAMAASTGPRLPPADLRAVEGVLAMCADTLSGLHDARTVGDVGALAPRVAAGYAALRAAAGTPGRDAPFAGLCATDPAHGRAIAPPPDDPGGPDALCRDCRRLAERDGVPAPRLIPIGHALVPYTAVLEVGLEAPATHSPHLNA